MPRCPIANVGGFTSNELPILPFLAPRVFADSPIYKQPRRWFTGGAVKRQKELGLAGGGDALRDHENESAPLQIRQRRSFNGLSSSGSFGLRYADISDFVRQHARSFSTEAAIEVEEQSPPQNVPVIRKRRRSAKLTPLPPLSLRRRQRRIGIGELQLRIAKSKSKPNADRSRKHKQEIRRRTSEVKVQSDGRLRMRSAVDLQRMRRLALLELAGTSSIKAASWTLSFAALSRTFDPWLQKRSHPVKLRHGPLYTVWERTLFDDTSIGADRQRVWVELQTEGATWSRMLLHLLEFSPERALDFLRFSNTASHSPRIVADALWYLSKVYLQASKSGEPLVGTPEFVPLFIDLFERRFKSWRQILPQDLLYSLLHLADPDQKKALLDLFITHSVSFRWPTLIHYAEEFGKAGEYEYGLRALDRAITNTPQLQLLVEGAPRSKEARIFTKAAVTVLRRSVINGINYQATSEIVSKLLSMGVKMSIAIYTVIIHNAVEAGDFQTAFRVYNLLEDGDIAPNAVTYSVLLQGCKNSNEPAVFRDFADHCANKAEELKSSWLATEYLHYNYVCLKDDDIRVRCKVIGSIFSRFFDTGLFTTDLLTRNIPLGPQFHGSKVMGPPLVAIFVALMVEIECRAEYFPNTLEGFYNQFHALVEWRHPVIARLASTPHIYNAFLMAFCQHRNLIKEAPRLVRDMSIELPPLTLPNGRQVTLPTPDPSQHTWTILMHGFVRHAQLEAAEKVLALMQKRGMEPDKVAWMTILDGYARAQRVKEVAVVMGRLRNAEGEGREEWAVHSLSKVRDRGKLMKELGRAEKVEKRGVEAGAGAGADWEFVQGRNE